ncbi:MAG TPA: FKBP-type peptidyl-prolyl cis-trans isomerase [Bacteroidia bacterium]|jgi:FKBP-type peptidyl-prolyl cis-trans isomerase|nr:FKBP-type peptidyl-prolyl cis-trans isomerase [Bacteroidia bacterium]
MFSLRNYCFLALVSGLFFAGCKSKPKIYFDGFSRNEAGLYYKIVSIGDGDYKINVWDDINFTCAFKKQNDSVFFSSSHEKIYFDPSDSLDKSMFLAHFRNLVKGDSVIYYIKTKTFFESYFQTPVPGYCKNDSLIKVEIGIKDLKKEVKITEKELKIIKKFIKKNDYKIVTELPNKIFILEHEPGTGTDIVAYGKSVTISYKGSFLNDSLFDSPLYPLQFNYGTPDQLIKGLNFVIKGMHKGEFIKIILPSYLAYGESGNTNGTVAPFTPLLYEVKITDIK